MSDYLFQLQNINLQMKNLSAFYDSVLMQMNGMNNTGNQLENIGIQMINMGIQLLNIGVDTNFIMNNLNLNQQIQNIRIQLNNIEMKQNMKIQNNQNNNFLPFQMDNNMISFPMANNNMMIQKKMEITFKQDNGKVKIMLFDYGKTVQDILREYLSENGLQPSNRLAFVYNASRLNYSDYTPIEKKFESPKPVIMVLDTDNLRGG